ncbi:MAG: gliding motility-associated C-terminal domain-containing protein [Bacteroidota bacterium]
MKAFVNITLLFTFCISSLPTFAQLPPLQPEQDCINAIPVCQDLFYQVQSYVGSGRYPNEINPYSSCLLTGEQNDVWYTFTIQLSGNLCFSIIPNDPNDDYDWSVYNLTQANCSDIFSQASLEVSCNFHTSSLSCGGITGANGNVSGPCGDLNESCIPVLAGETYVLNVSNFTASNLGYTLDFSQSTAEIYDNTAPEIESVVEKCGKEWWVTFDESILISSVQSSDFELTDANGNVLSIVDISPAVMDTLARYTNLFSFELTQKPDSGQYNLSLIGDVLDPCGNIGQKYVPYLIDLYPFHFELTTTDSIICPNQAFSISHNSVFEVNWYDQMTNQQNPRNLSLEQSQWIWADGMNEEGCVIRDSIWLGVSTVNFPTIELKSVYCEGDSIILPSLDSSQTYQFSWDYAGVNWSAIRDTFLLANGLNSQHLQLKGQTNACPIETQTYAWDIQQLPDFQIVEQGSTCEGSPDHQLQIDSNAASYEVDWYMGEFLFGHGPQLSLENLQAGTLTFIAWVTDDQACASQQTKSVEIDPVPKQRVLEEKICGDNKLVFSAKDILNNPSDRLFWQLDNNWVETDSFHVDKQNAENLWTLAESSKGCRDSVLHLFEWLGFPETSILVDPHCEGEAISISLIGSTLNNTWTLNGESLGTQQSLDLPFLTAGPHQIGVQFQDIDGCSWAFDSTFHIHKNPFLEISVKDSLCLGEKAEFSLKSTEDVSLYWSANQMIDSVGLNQWSSLALDSNLVYEVFAIDANGCRSNPQIGEVYVFSNHSFQWEQEIVHYNPSQLELKVSADASNQALRFNWNWGDGSEENGKKASKLYAQTGNYFPILTAFHPMGCEVKAQLPEIQVRDLGIKMLPTAFTPNNDGINDEWEVNAPLGGKVFVRVFNRWGKLVFEGNGSRVRWKGDNGLGSLCQEGVYTCRLSYFLESGETHELSGSISLIR